VLPPIDTIYAHTDTTLCTGTNLTLTAPGGYTSYIWNNDSTTSAINITAPGTYIAYCKSPCGSVLIDSFHIQFSVAGDTTYTHADTTVCAGTTLALTLAAPGGYTSYIWNNGATTSAISATTPGTYIVYCTICGSILIDSFNIALGYAPQVNIPADTELCAGNNFLLSDPQPAGSTYLWSTGATTSAISVITPGAYWLQVTNIYGCTASDTTHISYYTAVGQLYNVTPNQTIPYGSSVQLNADGALYYMWTPDNGSLNNPNINNPIASPLAQTIYTVYGINTNGCRDTAYVTIDVIHDTIFIPSAFTPNGDGLNDVFRVGNLGYYKLVEMSVYNRWGNRVYYTTDGDNSGWNGTYEGVRADMDVYFYDVIVAGPDGKNHFFKGDVTLVR
jgi:gliding motility-associated-like protein